MPRFEIAWKTRPREEPEHARSGVFSRFSLATLAVLLGIPVGLLVGLGSFTFIHAEGFSYLSSDPKACVNCHIMRSEYDSWRKGSHHVAAKCVDCHLPHDLAGKYLAKANNGYHHSKGFTFQDFHEPIMIKPGNSRILQESCLRCHEDMVHDLVAGATSDRNAVRCVHCHQSVGHGELAGLGGRDKASERKST
jgi:cytochrome c nitrite reductase small subunit